MNRKYGGLLSKVFGPASPKQKMILESKAQILIIGGAAGCLSKDHEVLTPSGWIKISEWSGQDILQYDKATGEAKFIPPLEFVKLPCDKLTRIEGNGICQELSDEHTVLFKEDYHTPPKTQLFSEIAETHKNSSGGWEGKFITTFNYSGAGLDLDDETIRERVLCGEITEDYYNCSRHQLDVIMDAIIAQGGMYSSSNKSTADFIQFVVSCFDCESSLKKTGSEYIVNVNVNGGSLRALNDKEKVELKEFIPTDGFKYCFVTQTGFFVTRLEDCVVVTGNSGKSYLLQLMPLAYVDDPQTACIMFRRTTPQLTGAGGLFDTAKSIYLQLDKEWKPKFREKALEAIFPSGAKVLWRHMEYENNKLDHQGE